MRFFVDTADIEEIKELRETGMLDGVTTNPSLILKSGREFLPTVKEICELLPGLPVSAEVIATDLDGMLEEGRKLAALAENVVVKVPMTWDGIKATRRFAQEGIKTNVTLCFSPSQALVAAKAGATFVSPFVGRHDDLAENGMGLISEIKNIYRNYPYLQTQILVASVRSPLHVVTAGYMGANVCTIPPKVIRQLVQHPLTDKGLEQFLQDWQQTGQKI